MCTSPIPITAGSWSITRGSNPPANVNSDAVFGQSGSFTSGLCDNSRDFSPTAGTLCSPQGVAVDRSGHLYIADTDNSRVLEYNSPLVTSSVNGGANASLVFGQSDFASSLCNRGVVTPGSSSLCVPSGVAVDAPGDLLVADTRNNRVLLFSQPLRPTPTPTPTPTPAPTPTPTPSPTPIPPPDPVSGTPENSKPSAGQTVDAGSITITNPTANAQTIESITVSFGKPSLFGGASMAISSGNSSVSSTAAPAATTIFTFTPPFTLAANTMATAGLKVTVAANVSSAEPRIRIATIWRPAVAMAATMPPSRNPGANDGAPPVVLVALGMLALAFPMTRRRKALTLAAVLVAASVMLTGCDPCPKCVSVTSVQTVTSIQATTSTGTPVEFTNLPATLSTITTMT